MLKPKDQAAAWGLDWNSLDADQKCDFYERLKTEWLNGGLSVLLPEGYDRDKLQIFPSSSFPSAFYEGLVFDRTYDPDDTWRAAEPMPDSDGAAIFQRPDVA